MRIADIGGARPLPGPANDRAPAKPEAKTAARAPEVSSFEPAAASGAPVALAVAQAHLPSRADPVQATVTPADVDRISSIKDGAARNLQITQAYKELSDQTAKLLGDKNASWATFAVWASRQVGVSIRGEDLPKFLVDGLKAVPELAKAESKVNAALHDIGLPELPKIPDILLKASAAETTMSDALAGGNKIVFQEIGKEFAIFDQTFQNQTHYDPAMVQKYLAHFTPAQHYLKDAFAAYAKAMFEKNPDQKAQLMLYANALVGLHEQTRLQPYIDTALNSPRPVVKEAIQKAVDESLSFLPGPLKSLAEGELNKLGGVTALTNAADAVFRHAVTGMMMRLTTPTEDLKLGQDVPVPPGKTQPFPTDLTHLTDPALVKLVNQLDPAPDTLKGSAANDWSNLSQRMTYILDLFRSRQEDPTLFEEPFGSAGIGSPGPMPQALVA